jgi:C-terminal processing protease CtpA/Prc
MTRFRPFLLSSSLALACLTTSLHSAETNSSASTHDGKREAQLRAEMQQLVKRMSELNRELASTGAKRDLMAYTIENGELKTLSPGTQLSTSGDWKHLSNLSALGNGVALGTLLRDRADGVFIEAVTPGSGAEKAGIKANDQVLSVRGKPLAQNAKTDDVRKLIGELKPQESVQLGLKRNGQVLSVNVTASAQPRISMIRLNSDDPNMPAELKDVLSNLPAGTDGAQRIRTIRIDNGAQADLDMVSISPELSTYFGTSTGVLVLDANGYAPLLGGDVITTIDNSAISRPSDVAEKLAIKRGSNAQVGVIRQKKAANLTVAVPNHD